MFWTTGSVILILLKPLLGEISEDDRDLSTDILEYVLRRGEGKNDSTIASDILGFVKNKIEDSTFEEIPPEIFKFVLEEEESQTESNGITGDSDYDDLIQSLTDQEETDIIIEDLLPDDVSEGGGDGSCPERPSLVVLNSTTYVMTSADSSSSADIILQQVEGETEKINFGETNIFFTFQKMMLMFQVCNFTTSDPSLVSAPSAECVPEIWLVSGHSDCSLSQLPDTVRARRLAEIHSQGPGQSLVDLSWEEVTNTCVLIVRKKECEK